MNMLIRWAIFGFSILVAAYLVPGVETTVPAAFVLAIVLGLLNAFVRPVLALLTLPLTVLTLGLFALVLNALMVMLAGYLVPGFAVSGFWPAFFFAIVLALVGFLLRRFDD